MQPREFYIPTRWRLKGTAEQVYGVLSRPREFARWWPEVYLAVSELRPGDVKGVGRVVALRTKRGLEGLQRELAGLARP
jgi:hypothetical protein